MWRNVASKTQSQKTKMIHSLRRRKQHGNLWSSRRDWQSVVCEWRDPWDVGPRTRNGTWEDKRREKKASLGQRTFLQETPTSKFPVNHLGKVVWEPLAQHLALAEVPFPSTRCLDGRRRVTSVEVWVFLFILSLCMLAVGVWLCLMRSKDIIDANMWSPNSTAA